MIGPWPHRADPDMPPPAPIPNPHTGPHETAVIRAEGKHPWLTTEDAVLDRLDGLTRLYGPLRAAQALFAEGRVA